jgi:hypothetical protein
MHARQLERRVEWLSRGGGTASGIFGACSGVSTCHTGACTAILVA